MKYNPDIIAFRDIQEEFKSKKINTSKRYFKLMQLFSDETQELNKQLGL